MPHALIVNSSWSSATSLGIHLVIVAWLSIIWVNCLQTIPPRKPAQGKHASLEWNACCIQVNSIHVFDKNKQLYQIISFNNNIPTARLDVMQIKKLEWGVGRNTGLLSINSIFPKACDQKITPFYMQISPSTDTAVINALINDCETP